MSSLMTDVLRTAVLAGLAACASAPPPQPVAPARPQAQMITPPQPVPPPAPAAGPTAAAAQFSLRGDWDWRAIYRGQPLSGSVTFRGDGSTYGGSASLPGIADALVRSASVQGANFEIALESSRGSLLARGRFEDRSTIVGRISLLQVGDSAAFSARRR